MTAKPQRCGIRINNRRKIMTKEMIESIQAQALDSQRELREMAQKFGEFSEEARYSRGKFHALYGLCIEFGIEI